MTLDVTWLLVLEIQKWITYRDFQTSSVYIKWSDKIKINK